MIHIDGERLVSPQWGGARPGGPPPADLPARHCWDKNFPSWETPGVANVRAAPYGAAGDGITDDTDALQRAIDDHQAVFLPKGRYRVSRTLRLHPHTRLLGAHRSVS